MILAMPMMTASPNDVASLMLFGQTSHHCGTQWSNIILSETKNIISASADASLNCSEFYDIVKFGLQLKEALTEYWVNSLAVEINLLEI